MQSTLGWAKVLVRAISNPFQVFQRDSLSPFLGRLDNVLADPMVHPRLEATFLARKPFEGTARILARRLRARICLRLEGTAYLMPLQPVGIQRLAAKRGFIRQGSDVFDAQINAQCADCFHRLGSWLFDLDVEVVSVAFPGQRGPGGIVSGQGLSLEGADLERKPCAAVEQRQADTLLGFNKAEDPGVVISTGRPEDTIPRPDLTQARSHASNSPHRQVGRQAKANAYLGIASLVQGILTTDAMGSPIGGDKVAGIGKRPQGCFDVGGLLVGHQQLAGDGADAVHTSKLGRKCYPGKRKMRSHPWCDFRWRSTPAALADLRFLPGLTTGGSTKGI